MREGRNERGKERSRQGMMEGRNRGVEKLTSLGRRNEGKKPLENDGGTNELFRFYQ